MANIHVLVKNQDASGKGWLEAYTTYGAYGVYRIADEYQDMRLDLDSIGAEIITAAEAKSSIFADAYRGYVKLKAGDAISDDFPVIFSDVKNIVEYREIVVALVNVVLFCVSVTLILISYVVFWLLWIFDEKLTTGHPVSLLVFSSGNELILWYPVPDACVRLYTRALYLASVLFTFELPLPSI